VTASEHELNLRFFDYIAQRLEELLAASGITDYRPGASMRVVDEGIELRVESASRGRVTVGTIPHLEVARKFGQVAEAYVRELAARGDSWAPARATRTRESHALALDAKRYRDDGDTWPQVAEKIGRTSDHARKLVRSLSKKDRADSENDL